MDFDSQKECLEFEGRLLEAKQWKTRLFIARQCSHCSAASQLKVYKKGKLKKTINLDECYGMESGVLIHGEVFTLSVICLCDTLVIAFNHENSLLEFESWLRGYLGFRCTFHCYVLLAPRRSGLQAEQYVRLHLQDSRFCLVTGIPGSVMLKFFISDLQCYGAIRNKFCFQVKSDYNSTPPGVYVLRSSHCQKMDAYFYLASRRHLHCFLLQRAMRAVSCEKDDGQSHDCLNELQNFDSATTVAREGSFSCRSLRKELPCNCRKPKVKSSLSLNNEVNDTFSCESGGYLIRMYSDSLLGSPPPKMCHRCFQHKYINQAFVDSLEFYDNCKFTRNYGVHTLRIRARIDARALRGYQNLCAFLYEMAQDEIVWAQPYSAYKWRRSAYNLRIRSV